MSRYIIFSDGNILGDVGLTDYVYYDAKLSEQLNAAGSLTFSLLPSNPELPNVQLLKSIITVKRNGAEIWRGRVISSELDIYNRRQLTCEGALAFLNDIRNYYHTRVAIPITSWDTPSTAIGDILDYYNANCLPSRQILKGTIQPTRGVYYDFRSTQIYGEYATAIDALREVSSQAGGYYRIRYESGNAYLDLLNPPTTATGQTIMFGRNLLDITRYINGAGVITELFAISEYSGYSTTITDPALVSLFGKIVGYVRYADSEGLDDAATEQRAQQFFAENSMAQITISLTAVDLNLVDDLETAFSVGQLVRVISPPHGLSMDIVLSELETDLSNPASSRITLGASFRGLTTYVTDSIREGYNTVYRRLEGAYVQGVNSI